MINPNPLSLVVDKLWEMLEAHPWFDEIVPAGNRIKYNGTANEKDTLSSADVPEVRIVPVGGTLQPHRTSSSTSMTLRLALQLHTGEQDMHYRLLYLWWVLSIVLTGWTTTIGALKWEGQAFVKRMVNLEITAELLRPRPEDGIMGRELKGWATVWLAEIELWFDTRTMVPNG